MNKDNKVEDTNPPLKEVCKFTKSIYPDLITGYPIEYYNMYKYMSDTLMWLSDAGITVNFNLYASGKQVPSAGLDVYGFYSARENKGKTISINRQFGYCISIEATKSFNKNFRLPDEIFRVVLFPETIANFKYVEVPKILDWYNNPTKYLLPNPKKKGKYTSNLNKGIVKEVHLCAYLRNKEREVVFVFEACPEDDGEGGSTGRFNIGIRFAGQFIHISWSKMFEFIHTVIDMNHQMYASTMLSFLGMAPVGIGMEPEYMAKYSKLKGVPKKVSIGNTNYFQQFNKTKVLGDALKLANSIVNESSEEKFRKEHGLNGNET